MNKLLAPGLVSALLLPGAVVMAQDAKAPAASDKAATTQSTPMMGQMANRRPELSDQQV